MGDPNKTDNTPTPEASGGAPPDPPPNDLGLNRSERQGLEQYLRGKQAAVLAILFSDIEGYTTLTERLGDLEMPKIREFFAARTVEITRRDGAGWVVKNIGDSYLSVFAEPSTAVLSALEMQEAFRRYRFEGVDAAVARDEGLKVRIGVHLGQVTIEESLQLDVFGRHVNLAARVMSLAAGGQVYASRSLHDSAQGWLHDASARDIQWENHGLYRLKGFDDPVEILEVYDSRVAAPRSPLGAERARAFSMLSQRTSLTTKTANAASSNTCSGCGKEFMSRLSLPAKCVACGAALCHACAAATGPSHCARHQEPPNESEPS